MKKDSSKIFIEKNALIRERIIRIIKDRQIKKKELAATMGIIPNALSRILQPSRNMTLKTVCLFEAALNIELIRCPRHE